MNKALKKFLKDATKGPKAPWHGTQHSGRAKPRKGRKDRTGSLAYLRKG